jgi:hypothetical protein
MDSENRRMNVRTSPVRRPGSWFDDRGVAMEFPGWDVDLRMLEVIRDAPVRPFDSQAERKSNPANPPGEKMFWIES